MLRELDKKYRARMRGMPIQYIQGYWYYSEIILKVRPPVFIPRTESSEIVDICLNHLSSSEGLPTNSQSGVIHSQKTINFFEVGPGSGAISLLLLHRRSDLIG